MKKTVITLSTIAMVTLGGTFVTDSVSAEKSLGDVKEERQEIKSKLSEAESEIADILYEIKDLNKEVTDLEKVLKENEKQLNGIEKKIKEYKKEINEIEDRIEERNEILKKRIASYQENGGNPSFMDVLLGSENFSELFSKSEAASTIAEADQELMLAQEKDMKLVEEKKEEQEGNKEGLEEAKYVTESQIKEVDKKKSSLKSKEKELTNKKSSLESEDSELSSLEDSIRSEIDEITENTEESNTSSPSTTQVASESAELSSNNSNATSNNDNEKPKKSSGNTKPAAGGGSAISAGKSVMGTPYVWGGTDPSGFDCSGFVYWSYKQAGKDLPRATGGQSQTGTKVSYGEAQAGDLVFFNTTGTPNSHVGIYLGGGQFLAANTTNGVEIKPVKSGYWGQKFEGHVRRVN